jgi:hypothetical protein
MKVSKRFSRDGMKELDEEGISYPETSERNYRGEILV